MIPRQLFLSLLIYGCCLSLTGCATGRTEYKIIKAHPPLMVLPEPAAATLTAQTSLTPVLPGETRKENYSVKPGESLWRICRRILGNPRLYPQVAQRNGIKNPDLIYPGQEITLDLQPGRIEAPGGSPTPTPAFPQRPNPSFRPGEKLMFSVEYFGIAAGLASLKVQSGPLVHNRPTYRLVAEARTHPAFEWIFKVRDRIESLMDAEGLFSWHYEKHLREGSYANDSEMEYDQLNHVVIKDQGRTKIPATPWVQDVLSEFYYFRSLPLTIGEKIIIPVIADDGKAYELVVQVIRRESIQVPAGKFACILVEPLLKFEGLFQQKGKLHIWVTDDDRKVPVLIKSQIIIGTIDIVLRDAEVVEAE